jgi:hypothetical protein
MATQAVVAQDCKDKSSTKTKNVYKRIKESRKQYHAMTPENPINSQTFTSHRENARVLIIHRP